MVIPITVDYAGLFLGVSAVILLITSEFLSSYYGKVNTFLDSQMLRKIALLTGISFMFIVVFKLTQISA